MESVDRIHLSRAPHMEYKYLFPNGVQRMAKALEYFRRVAEHAGNSFVRAVANEREFFRGALRILSAPYAPSGGGLPPPAIRPEGLSNTPGVYEPCPARVKMRPELKPRFCVFMITVVGIC